MTSPQETLSLPVKLCAANLHYILADAAGCLECRKAYQKEYWARTREERRQQKRDRYWNQYEEVRRIAKEWRRKNSEGPILRAMLFRCYNPKSEAYADYGGRGITVCDRWRGANGLKHFIEDMGRRPSSAHSVDRVDNDGNYEPSNCRWATAKEQCRNRRNNNLFTYNGRTECIAVWAEITGLPYGIIDYRIRTLRWSVDRALSTPILKSWSRRKNAQEDYLL